MTELTVAKRGRPAELLLVEDNYGDVVLTREAFRSAKIDNNLVVASDGEKAMSVLRREGEHAGRPLPDLILLDLNLPRMDGREVLQAVKSDPTLKRIPVIVLTSSNAEIDIHKSYDLNANGYIVKPVDFERLKAVVSGLETFWFSIVVLPTTSVLEGSMQFSPQPLRDDADLSDVEREFGEFSYMVSHDLAASFRHVGEFSRLLVAELGDSLTERQKSYADFIWSSNARCQAMLQQLLVYSRAQQKPLAPSWCDAQRLTQLAMLQLTETFSAAGAEIVLDPMDQVYADSDLLTLAIRHLLDNAAKFHKPDAQPRITVRTSLDQTDWRLFVIDNGLGVDPAHRERVFRMFHRLHGEDDYEGVGAGLALCRRIARRQGGDVEFLDCEGGACVELRLPARAPETGA